MSARRFAIALAPALLVASPARAQGDRWERQVHRQLERAMASLGAKRAVRPLATRVGTLDTDESASFTLTLQAGVSYVVVGTCDEDCEQLGLVLSTFRATTWRPTARARMHRWCGSSPVRRGRTACRS